ncbi:amidohydrolase [Heyndrickxia shackletonii]|uniref:Amidohydrolase n=1 Tax=Heyndrickxia shackletonii TaxID=157838 RepID=A0A0Q3WXZ3_9BACI|nr:amidohydrolase family protein [Heyndrickxia shackletonii]KQL53762.1 amidohydrolase [Heyndrickxia shackletonii]MBB2481572.1 amidohydrolase family protein [Bacillus sp. APMAM]NEY99912.1 amidohydrolase family protein [Heyndrickxia shackletonii]RTZ55063.1 amidohydrolase [Bacillus sp. SAJ1]
MKIIDAHMHLSDIKEFHHTAQNLSFVNYSNEGIIKEYKDAGVILGIGMGLTETDGLGFPDPEAETPMGLDLEESIPSNIMYCAGVNPYTLNENSLINLEMELQKPNVVGIKIYLGYYPFYAYDKVYDPIYTLAEKYDMPVVFHTGDTYSERGLLKYSHPLTLDEVAVKNRKVRFMMAHFGDPWVLTGAEVVYKNSNMYADLSGLLVGTEQDFKMKRNSRFFDHLKHALEFCDHYERLVFGTDWPLAPIKTYVDFIKSLIPEKHYDDVFFHNALKVFPKIKNHLK